MLCLKPGNATHSSIPHPPARSHAYPFIAPRQQVPALSPTCQKFKATSLNHQMLQKNMLIDERKDRTQRPKATLTYHITAVMNSYTYVIRPCTRPVKEIFWKDAGHNKSHHEMSASNYFTSKGGGNTVKRYQLEVLLFVLLCWSPDNVLMLFLLHFLPRTTVKGYFSTGTKDISSRDYNKNTKKASKNSTMSR